MTEEDWSMTKRAFLMTASTVCLSGCLGDSPSQPSSQKTPSQEAKNKIDTDPEPSTEAEADSPTLFLDGDSREDLWDVGDQWRTGTSLDEWDVLSGSIKRSPERLYRGFQSVHLTATDDDGVAVRIPIEGYDLTQTSFSLAMYIDTPGTHYTPSFDVNAPACGQTLEFRTRYKIDEPGWIRYDLGLNDISTLDSATESYMTISWGGSDIDWYISDFRAVPVNQDPRLFIQFDDSLRSTYDTAFPIMRQYDVPATVYTVTDRIGNTGSLTLDQMKEMQDAGWEFASHTLTHQRTGELPLDEQRTELEDSKRWLLDHGFEQAASMLAYPFGSFTTETMDIAADYYDFATSEQRGAINRRISSPLSVNRHPGDNVKRSMELIDLLLDDQIPTDTLVLCYHDVIEDNDPSVNPDGFRETMAYIDDQDIDCRVTSELRDNQSRNENSSSSTNPKID